MPTYTYQREDGSRFEIEQRITADPLEVCPETGQDVERIIVSAPTFEFKGSGFYETDYKDDEPEINVIRNEKPDGID